MSRNRQTGFPGYLHPAWTLALPLVAMTAVIVSPPERRLPMVVVAAVIFGLMQWIVPNCRFRAEYYFSPVNIALLLILVKLIIAPIFVMAVGPTNDLFIGTPSMKSMEGAMAIDLVAYVALCLGLAFHKPRQRSMLAMLSETPGPAVLMFFASLGLLGFLLAFPNPGKILDYFLEPSAAASLQREQEASWSGFLGTILRPFLAFAMVAGWSRSVDRSEPGRSVWRPLLAGVVAAAGITLANLTFSFNRAAFVFPVATLVAVYHARARRIPLAATAAALALILPLLFAIGYYRADMLSGGTAPDSERARQAPLREASDTVQAYAGGPPLTGLFLDEMEWGGHLFGGSTLVASALSPVPILGKAFRESSGSALYNQTLYGMPGYEDQIIPFSAELFVNFHAAGVVAGFFALGLVLCKAELWFASAGSTFGAFAIQYIAMWCAMLSVWSVSILSQIAIYFLGPVYLYWALVGARKWLRGMRVHRAAIALS